MKNEKHKLKVGDYVIIVSQRRRNEVGQIVDINEMTTAKYDVKIKGEECNKRFDAIDLLKISENEYIFMNMKKEDVYS